MKKSNEFGGNLIETNIFEDSHFLFGITAQNMGRKPI